MSTRIWINRARTYKAHLIAALRGNPDGRPVSIYATHPLDGPAMSRADVALREPDRDVSDEEYIDWALNFVQKHGIEILFPSDRFAALATHQREFENLGVTLLSQPSPTGAAIADSKTATYDAARRAGLSVPEHYQVTSASGLAEAFTSLHEAGHEVCIKPDTGWAADGFRILTAYRPGFDDLFVTPRREMFIGDYLGALVQAEEGGRKIEPLIVAPVMHNETSVDLLRAPDGQIIVSVARAKGKYNRTFDDNPVIHHIARTMAGALEIAYLSNIQTRELNGVPTLLEVNPRGSDGLTHCLNAGVNIAWAAVRLALGERVAPMRPDTSKSLYVIDTVIEK